MEIVYLETTVFSFYFDDRTSPAIVAMHDWTRQFWDERREKYDFVTSEAVLNELRSGGAYHKTAALNMAMTVPLLPVGTEIDKIVHAYIGNKIMPQNPAGDALHLAFASVHECDYLTTWNCRHLANANKFGHIRQVNRMLGLKSPELVTPQELLGENE